MKSIFLLSAIGASIAFQASAQPLPGVDIPPGYRCSVVNTTNSGNINITCSNGPPHDDAIFQRGYEVGRALGFRVGDAPNSIFFDSLVGGADFQIYSDFEFKGMTIGDCHADREGHQGSFGQITQNSLGGVRCVAKASPR